MDQERLALLALHMIPGVGSYTIRQLVSYCGAASRVFSCPKNKLLKIPGIGKTIADLIKSPQAFLRAESLMHSAAEKKVGLLFHTDESFPRRLRHIPDCPSLLYTRGSASFNQPKVVAVVGTRKATSYGTGITRELVSGLSAHGVLIVSGLAYGIDAQAHKSALDCGLDTVAVMAGGIEYIYPSSHRHLAHRIRNQGALLTENGIDTTPDASRFPARNRIIAGLSDVVLVIEAAERGGALITAAIANDYDREVLAVPGNLGNPYSTGCNHLIKRHRAHLLTRVEDIEYLMNWDSEKPAREPVPELGNEEQELIDILNTNAGRMHLDQLSWASRKSVGKTASLLLQLEFKELVISRPGKIYELAGSL